MVQLLDLFIYVALKSYSPNYSATDILKFSPNYLASHISMVRVEDYLNVLNLIMIQLFISMPIKYLPPDNQIVFKL